MKEAGPLEGGGGGLDNTGGAPGGGDEVPFPGGGGGGCGTLEEDGSVPRRAAMPSTAGGSETRY